MVNCFAGCKNQSESDDYKYFRFPKDQKERKRWIDLIGRTDKQPTEHSRVCSYHFIDGKKENGPTIFKRNEAKLFRFESPEKSKKRKRKSIEATPIVEDTDKSDVINSDVNKQNCRQCDIKDAIIDSLERQIQTLKLEISYFSVVFSFEEIKDDNKLVHLYTGIPSAELFKKLVCLVEKFEINYYYNWGVGKVKKVDQLLMTLMKLRRNDPQLELAHRFRCSRTTVQNIIITWIHVLHEILVKGFLGQIPSRLKNQGCMPDSFVFFTNCRITLDCTEIKCAIPKNMLQRNLTYSYYKHNNTFKGLVGVAPNGVVTFLSELFAGSVSDKEIVRASGVLPHLITGDLVLADKGFLIHDILPTGVSLNIPPFLTNPQFSKEQCLMTRKIARARIHVERAINKIKNFTILDFVPSTLRPHVSIVWQVCGALTNLQYPLIKEIANAYVSTHPDDDEEENDDNDAKFT